MDERPKGAALFFLVLAAVSSFGVAARTPVIDAGSLRMTGMAMDPVTISAESLRMTGMALDPATIDAGSLRMTGQASTRLIIKPEVVKPPHTR
jgi:hypothetical protein